MYKLLYGKIDALQRQVFRQIIFANRKLNLAIRIKILYGLTRDIA